MQVRIVITDDNHFLTKVIEEKLSFFEDFELKFTAVNGIDLLKKLELNSNVDLILMDLEMPGMNGIEATAEVKKRYPQIKIIMLTVFDDEAKIFKAIKAGADGYLLKEIDPQALYDGITDTLSGGAAMTPSVALKTLKLLRNPLEEADLTNTEREEINLSEREIEVLEQLSQSLTYTQIADNLILSPNTVRKHIENIYKKLHVSSKLEAIDKARRTRII